MQRRVERELPKQHGQKKKKKNHWKCTADRCGCSSGGKCGNVVLRDFRFFFFLMYRDGFVLFRLLLFSFINVMNWVNGEGATLLPQKLFHVLSVKTNKQNFIIFTASCSDWNSWGRNLPQLCLFRVFLVLFRSLMFDLVEFRFLDFTITHLGMKPNQKEPFVKGLWWSKKALQN